MSRIDTRIRGPPVVVQKVISVSFFFIGSAGLTVSQYQSQK